MLFKSVSQMVLVALLASAEAQNQSETLSWAKDAAQFVDQEFGKYD